MASDPNDLVGKIVGGCRIGKLIGSGGMGAVFEAFHVGLEKKVAVKVLLPGHPGEAFHDFRGRDE